MRSSSSWVDRLVVAEVEAQPVRADERAGLLHVRAEHLAQRPVQDVGRGVVAADRVAARAVDRGDDLVALGELALARPGRGAAVSRAGIAYCVSSTRRRRAVARR